MAELVLHKRFSSWQFRKLEQLLDAQAAQGYALASATHKRQVFTPGGVPCRHRLGYCAGAPGSAEEITYLAAQERAGWELVCREQGWLYFRKPLDAFAEGTSQRLEGDRESIDRMFAAVIRRLEIWRRIELVLTAALVVVGYATVNLVMRLAVIPLLLVLGNTYLIKYMQEALENDALAG